MQQTTMNPGDETLAGAQIEEPNVYSQEGQESDLFTEAKALEFSVRDPQDFHGHIVYVVKGRDNEGPWECKRRFNEFYILYDTLRKRWPGIILPLCPPKKAVGNKDIIFLQERRFYLERFMRKICVYDFIINSEEFLLFSRPQGLDVEKSMSKMVKLSSNQLYERLRDATQTDPEGITEQDREQLNAQLAEFSVYIKKAAPFLKKMQADIAQYLTKKQMLINAYNASATTLTQYEETNLTYYVDQ